MHDLDSYIRSPVRVLTVREFMGEDYEKGETMPQRQATPQPEQAAHNRKGNDENK